MAGILQLLAALLIAAPSTRLWGAVLGGMVNFVAVVMLLKNREYVWAAPGFVVLLALLITFATAHDGLFPNFSAEGLR